MTFRVEIELGNAEMESTDHVARALRKIAADIDGRDWAPYPTQTLIRDVNGNTVGCWSMS